MFRLLKGRHHGSCLGFKSRQGSCLVRLSMFSTKPRDNNDRHLQDELKRLTEKLHTSTKEDINKLNMAAVRERKEAWRIIFNWKTALITLSISGSLLAILLYLKDKSRKEQEKQKKIALGKARIGGDWQLLNTEGKLEGSEDLKGNWLLMYFGFTHCPDICPDEIEKMAKVIELLESDEKNKIPIVPVFISVDPERDTIERVKKYCSEFSPKLRGYTGSKEQVAKVTKTFRVYYSQGPRTAAPDDYIVDHTVIMYLMDPDGKFHDYYGQNRSANQIADVIRMKVLKYERV